MMSVKNKIIKKLVLNYVVPHWAKKASRKNSKALLWTAAGVGAWLATRAITRRLLEYDFAGKTVLITGGSRGLGLVMAREFLREGARVAICARDEDELERAYHDLKQYGSQVFTIPCDVTDRQYVDAMVVAVRAHFGQIDALVNNAGIITVGPAEEMTIEDYQEAMNTNFWASLYTISAVLPEMRARGEGHIINIASIGGKISVPHLLPYSASKFALVGLSSGLNAELRKDGVIVTTVCPGLMRTGSPRNANFKGQHRDEYAWFVLSDSLPFTSMSAERAARQVIAASKRGDAEMILSIQAKLAIKFNALFPEITAEVMGLVNRLLPDPGGIGKASLKGRHSHSEIAPSLLTALDEEAARKNNQIH
jgi:short-subunit dehydrogenase